METAIKVEIARTVFQPLRFLLCSIALLPALVLGANIARDLTPTRLDKDGDRAAWSKEAKAYLEKK